MDLDQIIARLAEASDDELREALSLIQTTVAETSQGEATEDSISALEALADANDSINTELGRRAEAAAELAARQEAALGRFTSSTDDGGEADGEGTDGEDGGAEGETDGDADDGDGTEGDGDGGEGAEGADGAVTAAGRRKAKLGSISRAAAKRNRATARAGLSVSYATAVGEVNGFATGQRVNQDQAFAAMVAKFEATNGIRGTGKHSVLTVQSNYPDARFLSGDASASINTGKINAIRDTLTTPDAITAAGGLCAPLENLYDIEVLGVTQRPIRDTALTRFGVDRGGIQWRGAMSAADITDGFGIWTVDDDEDNDDPDAPSPAKVCGVVECPGLQSAIVYSTYMCLQFPNFTARFDSEWVAATTRQTNIAWTRFAENQLLQRILSGSKILTAPAAVSATRDVLVTLDKAIAYLRNRHRLNDMMPLRWVAPRWVLELFRADLTRGFSGDLDALAVADSLIMSWFRARGVNVTWHLDGLAATTVDIPPVGAGAEDIAIPAQTYANAVAGGVVPPFIDSIDSALYPEGDWLFLDGGQLDLGLVRDSRLNRVNRYQQFMENWEGTAYNGVESLRLVMEVQPTGAVVGTLDPAAAADFTD